MCSRNSSRNFFEGDAPGHGKDFRARGHYLADQLVAELDGGANQVAVALFEDALLLAGFEQSLDIDGGLLFGSDLLFGERGDGEEEADEDGDGGHQPEQQANGPDEARSPAATGAVEEQRGQKLVAEDDHQHEGENGLRDLGVAWGGPDAAAIKEHRAEFEGDEPQGKLLQDRGADSGMVAGEAELRLDQLFPGVEVLLLSRVRILPNSA